ncbi:glutamate receptor ionotropic, kainate glr-3-like [Procambarus clarkii]|uniref:glutamate receptor ionotropic, kainate glr-3-like n=1 Tax=Procambarus clarkii TaxID=6728 RepID=UPI0037423D3F
MVVIIVMVMQLSYLVSVITDMVILLFNIIVVIIPLASHEKIAAISYFSEDEIFAKEPTSTSFWLIQTAVFVLQNYMRDDQFKDFMGHNFHVVSVPYFPYVDYQDTNVSGGTITLVDSLDARLLDTFSPKLNFTYETRVGAERAWGREDGGRFSGMMGQLQREDADFCTMASMTTQRLTVMQLARAYESDILTLISLKPALLPEYLSFVRPFTGELWATLMVSVMVWSTILWLLRRAWQWVAGGRVDTFTDSFMYGWGALLGQPPPRISFTNSGKVLVGGWLVFCLVITTGYSSSLVAHLTIQSKTHPLDTFEDMVTRPGWKWGIETWILKGVPYDYLSKHTSPVVKKVYKEMEVLELDQGLTKVQAGRYAYISMKNHLTVVVPSLYADARGQIPFYISQSGVYSLPDYGWGFRKGAPFYTRFSTLMARLVNTGIMGVWTNDVIAKKIRQTRAGASSATLAGQDTPKAGLYLKSTVEISF